MRKASSMALLCVTLMSTQLTRTFAWTTRTKTTTTTTRRQYKPLSHLCRYATNTETDKPSKSSPLKTWSLYMIRCGSNNSLYTGITTDVQRRFQQHVAQSSKTAKYLRGKGPLELVYVGNAGKTRSEASKLEHVVKSLPKARKEALVRGEIRLDSLVVVVVPTKETASTTSTSDSSSNKDVAPMYITIGPPCSGKTEALRSHLLSAGYNPDDVFDRDVALGDQGGVYHKIPLDAFLSPSTRLDDETGSKCLHGTTTVRDRLADPAFLATDQEMRNVLWRVAGRITPREFATRCQAEQARRAMGGGGSNNNMIGDPYLASMRRALAHDLARAVEQVVVQAVAEVICQMQFERDEEGKEKAQSTKPTPTFDDNGSATDPDEIPDSKKKRLDRLVDLDNSNATQANLLSARKLIGTSHIDLFVPQALFQKGIHRAKESLSEMLASSRPDQPVSWGNTNTRPTEFAAALAAAEQAGRPVEFIVWGTNRFPGLSRQELFRRSIARLRRTGRYIPAGVIEASLGRVESLLLEAQRESDLLFLQDDDDDDDDDDDNNDYEDPYPLGLSDEDLENHKMNVALASLAGFYMDNHGFVTCVDEPRRIPNLSLGRHPIPQ